MLFTLEEESFIDKEWEVRQKEIKKETIDQRHKKSLAQKGMSGR